MPVEAPLVAAVPDADSLLKSAIPNDVFPSPKLPGSPYPTAPFGNECCWVVGEVMDIPAKATLCAMPPNALVLI